jgi:hypothetical protein
MKFVPCAVWVLLALIAVASVDTIPDPPAVNPHTASATSLIYATNCDSCEQRLDCDLPSPFVQARWMVALSHVRQPNRTNDSVAITGHAADPSPPAV